MLIIIAHVRDYSQVSLVFKQINFNFPRYYQKTYGFLMTSGGMEVTIINSIKSV